MATIGIVIPTVDRLELLTRALTCLERQRIQPHKFEVVVVHGEAADTSALDTALAGRPYAARRLLSSRGDASSQRNVGWRALSTPVILFLDDDVLALPGLVAAHLQAHSQAPEPEVGVLGHVRWSRRPRPSAFMRWLEQGIQFDFRGLKAGQETEWWRFYTANASVKREMLELVGGFDEQRFPFGYEDLDLAARMAEHGFRLTYEPRAEAEHLHPQTLEDWRQRVWRIASSERRFCARHPQYRPYFHELFADAAARPPARGRGVKLAPFVPRRTPWLGSRVWGSFDLWHRQQLAPEFLSAWRSAEPRSSRSAP